MAAYYNEFDPFAAAWLRELITRRLIAPGDVDERSIEIVQPDDLAGYTQCHFFAGIGVWSYALRLAGWPDDRPVWTGSCPCQPFSAAGKGEGFDDPRHLWPHFFRLIRACGPRIARKHGAHVVFGEQVASRAGLAWLDVVSTDLENAGYAIGTVDTCAAGVGAPHIRQRSYWVAESYGGGRSVLGATRLHAHRPYGNDAARRGASGVLGFAGFAGFAGLEGFAGNVNRGDESRWLDSDSTGPAPETGAAGALADDAGGGRPQEQGRHDRPNDGRATEPDGLRAARGVGNARRDGVEQHTGELHSDEAQHDVRTEDGSHAPIVAGAAGGRVADTDAGGFGIDGPASRDERAAGVAHTEFSEPTRGFWGGADWLWCRDGKYRPVEAGTSPLAHGAPARLGRLRGYGNAIVATQAQAFVEAYCDVRGR